MNDFILICDNIKFIKSYVVSSRNSELFAETLEERINADYPAKDNDERFCIMYVFSLINKKFDYPLGESNVIYIGKTEGQKKADKISLGYRFKHCNSGSDGKQNMTLGFYYTQKKEDLLLELYQISGDLGNIESTLRYDFLSKFGALPIADGATFSKKKLREISEIMENEETYL